MATSSVSSLSSPGVGSGLDVNTIVSKLMAVEQQPLTALQSKEASYQAKISAYGTLKSALSSLQTAAQALATPAKFSPMKASVADSTILAASASSSAAAGSYDIEAQSLAKAQKLISANFAATDTVVGSGTITLTLGTYGSDGSFTSNPDKTAKTITIDSSNNTLTGIRDAINGASTGVTATILNDGTANRLVITSNDTGTSNALRLTVADGDGDNTDASGLSQLAYDAGTGGPKNLDEIAAASDAKIKIDTVTITKPSNVITDAITGVTLNLAKETETGSTTKLTVARDNNTLTSSIQAFVKAYNDANAALRNLSSYNATTKQGAALNGDSTVRSIQSQLHGLFNAPISGATGGVSALSDIGISFQKDGTLAVDSTKLQAALSDPNRDASQVFVKTGSVTGYASQIDTLVGNMLDTDGLIGTRIDGINSSIKDTQKREDTLQVRLDAIEQRYRAQFTALDTMISSMNQTSTYLTQQLAMIQANSSSANK